MYNVYSRIEFSNDAIDKGGFNDQKFNITSAYDMYAGFCS